jgi:SAM-dependent methyltransferase
VNDKAVEVQRYEMRARSRLAALAGDAGMAAWGAAAMAPIVRGPYTHYDNCITQWVQPGHRALEIGAGAGLHTAILLETGADVTATDLSPASLALLERNLSPMAGGRLTTRVADMESLPFESESFDVVTSAGSLSYGDARLVDAEIRRVLRPGGMFITVDSLNHNPIYRMNRWMQVVRGKRTWSTFQRMPDEARIAAIGEHFASMEVRYFGALTWAMPLVARLVGDARAVALSDAVDRWIRVKRSAFKFVLVARGRR